MISTNSSTNPISEALESCCESGQITLTGEIFKKRVILGDTVDG